MRKGLFIDRADSVKMSIRDALERYKNEILPTKRQSTAKNERLRLAQLQIVFGKYTLAALTPTLISEFRDRRLANGKSANTVRLDLAFNSSHLYSVAMREWGMGLVRNPVTQVRKPSLIGTARTRRIQQNGARQPSLRMPQALKSAACLDRPIGRRDRDETLGATQPKNRRHRSE